MARSTWSQSLRLRRVVHTQKQTRRVRTPHPKQNQQEQEAWPVARGEARQGARGLPRELRRLRAQGALLWLWGARRGAERTRSTRSTRRGGGGSDACAACTSNHWHTINMLQPQQTNKQQHCTSQDVEKLAAKKGVVLQSIKDVLQVWGACCVCSGGREKSARGLWVCVQGRLHEAAC